MRRILIGVFSSLAFILPFSVFADVSFPDSSSQVSVNPYGQSHSNPVMLS